MEFMSKQPRSMQI